MFEIDGKRIWVAGHSGMVGSAIVRRLESESIELLTVSHSELDLTRQVDVERWMEANRPEIVFLAAAHVGGIMANSSRPTDFIFQNLAIQTNIIDASYRFGVEKLITLGSACIYPRLASQPMAEETMLSGPLEPTNQWYAIAKIAGIKMCEAYRMQYGCDFISAQPTNLYGPGDNFDLERGHVIPALIRKAHQAKVNEEADVTVWGTGNPLREFMFVDDLADALIFLCRNYSDSGHINVGSGEELSIAELAEAVCAAVGFNGNLRFDTTKPDGMPRKLVDPSKLLGLGWRAKTPLAEGLKLAYGDFLERVEPVAQ